MSIQRPRIMTLASPPEKTLNLEEEANRKDALLRDEFSISLQLIFGGTFPGGDGNESDAMVVDGDGSPDNDNERIVPLLNLQPVKSRSNTKHRSRRQPKPSHSKRTNSLLRSSTEGEGGTKSSLRFKQYFSHFSLIDIPPEERKRILKKMKHDKKRDEIRLKKKKGRQGRSREVRERKKREEEERIKMNFVSLSDPPLSRCPDSCSPNPFFIEDHSSGDLICSGCGAVVSSGGISNFTSSSLTNSKPYMRIVHFRQRIAQLFSYDPEQKKEYIDRINEFIQKSGEDPRYFGKNVFSQICRELQIDPKVATHWMQIRKKLGIEPFLSDSDLDPEMKSRLNMRFFCVSIAFANQLKKGKGEDSDSSHLKRNNIININFLIIMLIRLESEFEFRKLAKFCPQLMSHQQPKLNNQRWKVIIDYCDHNYRVVSDPIKGTFFSFDWEYKPLTNSDLLNFFYFFK